MFEISINGSFTVSEVIYTLSRHRLGNKRKAQCMCQLCEMKAFVGLTAGSLKLLSAIDFSFRNNRMVIPFQLGSLTFLKSPVVGTTMVSREIRG